LLSVAFVAPGVVAGVSAATSCTRDVKRAPSTEAALVDDFGDTLRLTRAPERIASLNPATTELVFAVGAGARLIGRPRWDTYPDSARLVPDLGDGMRPNVEAIIAARPDLVLLYASGENRAARDALHRAGIPTFTQRIDRTTDFARAMMDLGRAVGDTARAATVRDSVMASLERARSLTADVRRTRVVWPLWSSPLMAVGSGSFLNELLVAAGAENIFADLSAPSPQVSFEEVVRRDPDVILVSPSGEAPIRTDPQWRALRAVREGRVLVYDSLIVGRPGVRLGEAAMYLAKLFHPQLAPPR
jgi:ABC-type Fe3+-hydroxamate transport system substrate-binding protein